MANKKRNRKYAVHKGCELTRNNDKIRLWVTVSAIVICFIAALILLISKNRDNRTVAYVNGSPIDVEEFKMAALHERTDVLTRLTEEWNIKAGPDFWTKEYKGVLPSKVLEKQALDTAVRMKLEQLWMVEAGLLKDESYSSFREEWKAENELRQAAKQRGEAVYGPVSFTEIKYYFYRQDKKAAELQNKLTETELSSTYEEQMEYYNSKNESFLFGNGVKKPFSEVNSVIVKRIAQQKYKEISEQKLAAAKITVRQKLLNNINYG